MIPQAAPTIGGIKESVESIRRQEVFRVLGRLDLSSPEEETAIERMSRALVDKLPRGPISEVITCAESETPPQDQRGPEKLG